MSGALSSVMDSVTGGALGGSLLGDIGGLLGSEFGPIGSMIGEAIGNALQQVVQNAVSQAMQQLQSQGMPSFVAQAVNDKTSQIVAQNTNPNVPAAAQQHVQDQYGAELTDLTNQTGAFIAASAAEKHKNGSKSTGGAGGWLEAIAQAMGEALGQQASALVGLSNKLSGEVQTPSTGSGQAGASTGGNQAQNTAQAQQFNEDMTQFQALSQQYSILQNTFTNAIQAIGTALQGMARKG